MQPWQNSLGFDNFLTPWVSLENVAGIPTLFFQTEMRDDICKDTHDNLENLTLETFQRKSFDEDRVIFPSWISTRCASQVSAESCDRWQFRSAFLIEYNFVCWGFLRLIHAFYGSITPDDNFNLLMIKLKKYFY